MVVDLGLSQTEVDKIVSSTKGVQVDAAHAVSYYAQATSALSTGSKFFGHAAVRVLSLTVPFHIATMLPLQLGFVFHLSDRALTLLMLPHVLRLRLLLQFFRSRQEDLGVDVRLVAFFRITFVTLAAAHWLGCVCVGAFAFAH